MSVDKSKLIWNPNGANVAEMVTQAESILETTAHNFHSLRQRLSEKEAEISLIEQERDEAIYLLVKVYQGWMTSNSDQKEIDGFEKVNSFLSIRGLSPVEPEQWPALAAFLNQAEQQES